MMKLPAEVHTSVTCFSRICHESVLVQLPGLVVGSFQDGGASHRSLGGRDQGEVLARNSQKNLPAITLLEVHFGNRVQFPQRLTLCMWVRGQGVTGRRIALMKESCWSIKLPQMAACVSFQPPVVRFPPGSEQTNAARACLGPGPQLSAGRQSQRCPGASLSP